MTVRLTRLEPGDEPALRDWTYAFLVDHLRWWSDGLALDWDDAAIERHILAHGLAERDLRRLFEAAEQWEHNLVVVARDEAPVGAVWAESRVDPFLAMELGVVAWIYVDPRVRGQGTGTRLVEAAKDWMRGRGLAAAQLNVTGANRAAVRMYEKAGLRVVDHRMLGRTTP